MEFEQAPKFFITSNYAPKGYSDSFMRRTQLIEFSNHYNLNNSPSDEFGDKDFFSDDWNQNDWNCFYSNMFMCIKLYLSKGMDSSSTSENVIQKQIIMVCGRDFYDFSKTLDLSKEIPLRWVHEEFVKVSGDDVDRNGLLRMLRNFSSIKRWTLITNGKGAEKRIIIKK